MPHGSVQVLPGTESLGDQGVTVVLEGPSWPPSFLPQGDRVMDGFILVLTGGTGVPVAGALEFSKYLGTLEEG